MCKFYNKQPQLTSCSVNNVSVYLSCTYIAYRDNDHSITVWMYLHCGPPSRPAQGGSALTDNQQMCSINKRVITKDINFELHCYKNHLNMWKMHTIHGKILKGENSSKFWRMVYNLLANYFITNDWPKISPSKIFPRMVCVCMYVSQWGRKLLKVILYCKN